MMQILKIRKPNAALHTAIREDKLQLYTVKIEAEKLKLVYRNESALKSLRLQIDTALPSHLRKEELFKQFKLRDFESIAINRYMGYTTFKCRKIVFEDQDGDVFALEVN